MGSRQNRERALELIALRAEIARLRVMLEAAKLKVGDRVAVPRMEGTINWGTLLRVEWTPVYVLHMDGSPKGNTETVVLSQTLDAALAKEEGK